LNSEQHSKYYKAMVGEFPNPFSKENGFGRDDDVQWIPMDYNEQRHYRNLLGQHPAYVLGWKTKTEFVPYIFWSREMASRFLDDLKMTHDQRIIRFASDDYLSDPQIVIFLCDSNLIQYLNTHKDQR
jgi:hypothetical protein